MKVYNILTALILCLSFVFTACDEDGEESISWKPGDSLIINGAAEVEAGTTGEPYYVEGFTINKEYTWSVDGSDMNASREGEFIYVDFPTVGTHLIKVSNGEYEGELTVSVVEPEEE